MGSTLTGFILAICSTFFLAAFLLYHFMVFRVNKNLPPSERIPHSLSFGQRDRLAVEYKSQYPRSILYQLTVICAVSLIVLGMALAGIRIWGAATGR